MSLSKHQSVRDYLYLYANCVYGIGDLHKYRKATIQGIILTNFPRNHSISSGKATSIFYNTTVCRSLTDKIIYI